MKTTLQPKLLEAQKIRLQRISRALEGCHAGNLGSVSALLLSISTSVWFLYQTPTCRHEGPLGCKGDAEQGAAAEMSKTYLEQDPSQANRKECGTLHRFSYMLLEHLMAIPCS